MKNKIITRVSAAIISILLLPLAYSNERNCQDEEKNYKTCDTHLGWYIGGDIGYATTDINEKDLDSFFQQSGLTANSISIDDDGTSFSLFGGYQFTTHVGVEVGYLDLGERTVYFTGQDIDTDNFYDNAEHVYPQSGNGFSIAVVGAWPLTESFKVSAKLGYLDWQGDYITNELSQGAEVGSDAVSGGDFWYGGELNYRIDDNFQVYLSAERFELARDKTSNVALGVRYYFGEESIVVKQAPIAKAIIIVKALDTDKDGVLDKNDQCPGTDISHQVDVVGCTIMQEQQFNFSLIVYFANDSYEIPAEYNDKISALAAFITKHQVKTLKVFGHTSAPGSRSYNLKLSEKRAESVALVLATQFNIDKQIIEPIGKGESEFIDDRYTEEAHKVNRRIELNIKEQLVLPVKRSIK
ncbi:hypothetical protein CXF85_11760 [Colwellia sp. 75C3]|uniref:OmpA family protein n=1 Tax=Colwellia sp. 75C3 TaxID=888425 RepID=UPI000C33F7F9|nr:OmpA family protein [Colwellia sp. 75C3]PKG83016.1 hypothetical protein CXF85_11760 [Colwellia sp. 75C3]